MCGDAYLLASGRDVAALSWQSDGPLGSGWNGRKASADAETLVAMAPDTLLIGPGETVREGLLPDTEIVRLDWAEDIEGVKANFDKLSVSGFRTDATSEPAADAPTVLYLSRAGGTAGPGTYVDAAIAAAGGRNAVGSPGWFTPDPEWIVSQDPDVVVVSFLDAYESVNAPLARNRAVARWLEARAVVEVPGRLWPCAGPGLAEAVRLIGEGVQ